MTALIALFCASACCNHADKPENVIYLIGDGMGFGAYPKHVFSTRGHTGNVVPIFAYGPGAENFSGVMKNTDIPKKIEELIR